MSKLKTKQINSLGAGTGAVVIVSTGTFGNVVWSSDISSGIQIPHGTTGTRPGTDGLQNGFMRFNDDLGYYEYIVSGTWTNLQGGAGINDLSDITGGAPALTDNNPAITTWQLTTKKSDAIDQLNELLGKLIPPQPTNFPGGQTLTVTSVGSSPLLANGSVADNTNGGTLPVTAGNPVTRVTSATVTTNTIGDNGVTNYVGPGNSGTLASVINNVAAGTVSLTTGTQNGTYGTLVVTNDNAYPSGTPGFWESFRAQIVNGAAAVGWNRFRISHTVGATNDVYFVRDNVTGAPVLAGGSIAAGTTTSAYSSGVVHYGNTNDDVVISTLTMTNLAGETYYNGNPISVGSVLATNHTGVLISGQNYSYANCGFSTPIARQTTGAASISALTVKINANNNHTAGNLRVTATNVNGNSNTVTLSSPTILTKIGTATTSQLDENAIVGSSVNAARTYLGSGFTGDTPAGPLPSGAANWVSSQDLSAAGYLHEAAVVGGVLSRNTVNYSTGYLPTNTVNYSTKSSDQYFTFVFTKSALSNFSLTISGTYSGLWIGLPGISDNNSQSPNALNGTWWTASSLYNGSGIPGRVGDTTAGCATGAIATGTSGTVNITFGTASSTNSTNNRIIVRLKLSAGQFINSISLSN